MARESPDEIIAIGVRHKIVVDAYKAAIEEAFTERPLFVVTGETTSFAKRRSLRKTLKASGNGILLCTQQSLPSSVNFEYVNKIIIPELHYNNFRMSQFYILKNRSIHFGKERFFTLPYDEFKCLLFRATSFNCYVIGICGNAFISCV